MPKGSDRCRQTPVWLGSIRLPAFVEYRRSRGAKRMCLSRLSTSRLTPRPGRARARRVRFSCRCHATTRERSKASRPYNSSPTKPIDASLKPKIKKCSILCRGQLRRRHDGAFQQSCRLLAGGPWRNTHAGRAINHQAALGGFLFVFTDGRAGLHAGPQASAPPQQFLVR
jgi:hypothetical protein